MKRFLIPSFIAAGLVAPQDNSFAFQGVDNNLDKEAEKEESILNFRLPFVLAGHSSHRSHGSHGSHGSHRSSSGGGVSRTPSVPKYTPPKSNSTSPESILPKIKPNSKQYSDLVLEMQTCLMTFGYYSGPLDGKLGSQTAKAISQAQKQNKMKVTGTIDAEFIKRCRYSLNK